MGVISLLRFIIGHPLNKDHKVKALIRFLKWQINIRLNPYPIIYPFTDDSKLIIQKGMTGATQNLYCGLQEFEDMAFLVHVLRKEDFFVDVGANIGSFSVLAGCHVGSKTYSIEPVPSTFSCLVKNIYINRIERKVTAFNIALGSEKRSIHFTHSLDTMNHAVLEDQKNTIDVTVDTLDDILDNHEVPLLLKIDVEGFESEVIQGALQTLQHAGLKAIIIELNGSGSRYGYNEREIHDKLLSLEFKPFQYNPFARTLIGMNTFGSFNTIYIRDLGFVQHRLQTAPKFRILETEI